MVNKKSVRARDLGICPGVLQPGQLNAITDVAGVGVGHFTLVRGENIRTGVTAIVPHQGNLYQHKVPANVAVGNGFGKMTGVPQIQELGEIETPILLTNTLSVPQVAQAAIEWTLEQPGNGDVVSINPVIGETNDCKLNDIRARAITTRMAREALDSVGFGLVEEGAVGAGTGTVAFGWKGGIGTSSRLLPKKLGGYSVGVLVQSNYGGVLQIAGVPVGQRLKQHYLYDSSDAGDADGSIMIVVATDAPLSSRNLGRLANRGLTGLARTGSSMTNGSGDFVIAFSTAVEVRRTARRRRSVSTTKLLPNDLISPLFQAVIESTEEAIVNSILTAATTTGFDGRTIEALPVAKLVELLRNAGAT